MLCGKAVGPALRATFNLISSHLDDLHCCDTVLARFIAYLGSDAATDEVNAGLPRTNSLNVFRQWAPIPDMMCDVPIHSTKARRR